MRKSPGLRHCEIEFHENDSFQTYLDADVENRFQFSVVKIPIGNLGLVHQMEDFGYRFLENQLVLSFNVEQLDHINSIWNRLFEGFSYKVITTKDDLSKVTAQVNDCMFQADRYSQDPFWKGEISSKRYVNWINELFESDKVKLYIMIKNVLRSDFLQLRKNPKESIVALLQEFIINLNPEDIFLFLSGTSF